MNFLIGKYGIFESLISAMFFSIFCFVNYSFLREVAAGSVVTDGYHSMIIAVDLMSLIIIALPYLQEKAKGVSNEELAVFLDIPDKETNVTFSTISEFLSDQALASFLATVLTVTGKQIFENFGGAIAALYVVCFACLAMILASISLIRFISHFTRFHAVFYGISAILSSSVMFLFFNIGLNLAV